MFKELLRRQEAVRPPFKEVYFIGSNIVFREDIWFCKENLEKLGVKAEVFNLNGKRSLPRLRKETLMITTDIDVLKEGKKHGLTAVAVCDQDKLYDFARAGADYATFSLEKVPAVILTGLGSKRGKQRVLSH